MVHPRTMIRLSIIALAGGLLLAACAKPSPQALGTLEYDRIALPATAVERIVAIDVHEGEHVVAGQALLQLNPAHTQAELAAVLAQAQQQREALAELKAGPRKEDIVRARANLAADEAQSREARAYDKRLRSLKGSQYVAAADLDRARAAAGSAEGRVDAARATLEVLLHGSRPEQIAQAQAALAAAVANVGAMRIVLGKLHVVAPRAGRIDSLPYRLGDQAPVGAPLAILLVGATPYARIYVPERERVHVHVGDPVRVFIDGRARAYAGKVRMLRSEPSFTPYYALVGEDAARLSYLAEVSLGSDAAGLPAGLPVHVEFPGPGK
ncbi:MAG: HlyD family efflux transporter periplasmic adaptor subunit [Rhodanobacter sp.]|nr:MAG: HlyD family efflux transporter periplasmic adaptor subunit [Rhodanobacter sp.]